MAGGPGENASWGSESLQAGSRPRLRRRVSGNPHTVTQGRQHSLGGHFNATQSTLRGVGRTLEERLRIEAETILSMFLRKDKHSCGAQASLDKDLKPEWPHHGL